MGNITRCPHCSTHFRVVADQLKLSDGWVRCGQCGEEFDAQASMVDLAALSVASQVAPAPAMPAVDILLGDGGPLAGREHALSDNGSGAQLAPDSAPVGHSAPVDLGAQQPGEWDSGAVDFLLPEDDALHALVEPQGPPSQTPASDTAAGVVHASADMPLDHAGSDHSGPMPAGGDQTAPNVGETTRGVAASASTAVPEVSFVRQARRQAFWQQPGVRLGLLVVSVLLAALLAVQALVHQRDRLAAIHPEWVPWLTAMCEPLGCQLNAWQAIGSVVIDSSALVRLRDNAFRFEVSLHNTSDLLLALPALELSLTNARDEVVVRRVILPTEWSTPVAQLPAQSTQPLAVQLSLTQPDELRMSGYRALVFYP